MASGSIFMKKWGQPLKKENLDRSAVRGSRYASARSDNRPIIGRGLPVTSVAKANRPARKPSLATLYITGDYRMAWPDGGRIFRFPLMV